MFFTMSQVVSWFSRKKFRKKRGLNKTNVKKSSLGELQLQTLSSNLRLCVLNVLKLFTCMQSERCFGSSRLSQIRFASFMSCCQTKRTCCAINTVCRTLFSTLTLGQSISLNSRLEQNPCVSMLMASTGIQHVGVFVL